jgi:hypothetical protein
MKNLNTLLLLLLQAFFRCAVMKNGDFTYKSDSSKGSISQKCMDLQNRNRNTILVIVVILLLLPIEIGNSKIVINNNECEWTGNCIICIDANCQYYYESMALVGEGEICEQSFCALRELVNPVEL